MRDAVGSDASQRQHALALARGQRAELGHDLHAQPRLQRPPARSIGCAPRRPAPDELQDPLEIGGDRVAEPRLVGRHRHALVEGEQRLGEALLVVGRDLRRGRAEQRRGRAPHRLADVADHDAPGRDVELRDPRAQARHALQHDPAHGDRELRASIFVEVRLEARLADRDRERLHVALEAQIDGVVTGQRGQRRPERLEPIVAEAPVLEHAQTLEDRRHDDVPRGRQRHLGLGLGEALRLEPTLLLRRQAHELELLERGQEPRHLAVVRLRFGEQLAEVLDAPEQPLRRRAHRPRAHRAEASGRRPEGRPMAFERHLARVDAGQRLRVELRRKALQRTRRRPLRARDSGRQRLAEIDGRGRAARALEAGEVVLTVHRERLLVRLVAGRGARAQELDGSRGHTLSRTQIERSLDAGARARRVGRRRRPLRARCHARRLGLAHLGDERIEGRPRVLGKPERRADLGPLSKGEAVLDEAERTRERPRMARREVVEAPPEHARAHMGQARQIQGCRPARCDERRQVGGERFAGELQARGLLGLQGGRATAPEAREVPERHRAQVAPPRLEVAARRQREHEPAGIEDGLGSLFGGPGGDQVVAGRDQRIPGHEGEAVEQLEVGGAA